MIDTLLMDMTSNSSHLNAAFAALKAKQLAQAREQIEFALQNHPDYPEALHLASVIYAQLEEYPTALNYLKKAVEIERDNDIFHNHLGNLYKKLNQNKLAIAHYQKAIELNPNQVEHRHNLAVLYYQIKDYSEAYQTWLHVLQLWPEHGPALFHLAQIDFLEQNYDRAKAKLEKIIALYPHFFSAYSLLGTIFFLEDDYPKALEYYQKALELDDHDIELLNNLGATYIKLHQDEQAIHCFIQAVTLNQNHIESLNNLATLYLKQDRYEIAARYYEQITQTQPNPEAWYNLGVCSMTTGELNKALNCFEKIEPEDSFYIDTLNNIATIFMKLNKTADAIEYYQQVLALKPQDAQASYMLSALLQKQQPDAAPSVYLKNLFDNYAVYYEKHMLEVLKYSLPTLILKSFTETKADSLTLKKYHILDLGCGTGLVAKEFQPYADCLVGVDISEKMLFYAKKQQLYQQLYQADLLEFLQTDPHTYDLIMAADVFVYHGNLSGIFSCLPTHLKPDSLFIFSIEELEHSKEDYHLQTTARYAHHPDYIQSLAQQYGFQVIKSDKIQTRMHNHQPIQGRLYVLSLK